MADINTVITKINDALNEAHLVAGTPNPSDQIAALTSQVAALQAQVSTLSADLTAAQGKLVQIATIATSP
jgi:outer membrane murein-binding lipoprotein Lpp